MGIVPSMIIDDFGLLMKIFLFLWESFHDKTKKFLVILRDSILADNTSRDTSDSYYRVREYFKFLNKNFKETLELGS